MKRDQKFFDMYSLVIGVLAFISLGIFVLAMKMSDLTQGVYTAEVDEYRAEVQSRLAPFGKVLMPGDEIPADEPVGATAPQPEPVAATLTGPQVYNQACIACHGAGVGGAPVLTDASLWADRLAQGNDTLYNNAINGFQGQVGYMPPKGGRLDFSDDEIRAAVDFMLGEIPN